MENHKLVLPEHLNHFGFLFGGHLLQWVDECAWIGATLDHPDCEFVTIAMDNVEFKRSVRQGAILRFQVEKARQGTTSVEYAVNVFSDNDSADPIFTTHITFVRIDSQGNKLPLPRE